MKPWEDKTNPTYWRRLANGDYLPLTDDPFLDRVNHDASPPLPSTDHVLDREQGDTRHVSNASPVVRVLGLLRR